MQDGDNLHVVLLFDGFSLTVDRVPQSWVPAVLLIVFAVPSAHIFCNKDVIVIIFLITVIVISTHFFNAKSFYLGKTLKITF